MFNKIVHYTPQWHTQLLQYMKLVYPKRNINYLKWWLSNINISNSDCWRNCIIVLDDETIIGCTSVNEVSLIVNGIKEVFYFRGNTIISPNYRGKGISKVIYNSVNSYNNWISVGVTDIAWKIQPKYVKNFTPLRPINVYITLNFSIIKQALYKCLHRQLSSSTFPDCLAISSDEKIIKVNDVAQMVIPKDGKWTSDEIEFTRDIDFFRKRYVDIYCADRYGIYQYMSKGRSIGYVVLRKIVYKGLDMVSLVDYRFFSRIEEIKAFKAASIFAKHSGIGFVITLSSRKYGFCLKPLTIKMKKELNCAVGMNNLRDGFNDTLITSADSDLDFVYYK